MPVEHYENFPVASLLMPAHLRPAVQIIYAFARTADDFADEGNATSAQRIMSLEQYECELDLIENEQASTHQLFQQLAIVIQKHQLPLQPFRDLLSAFKQDVVTKRYPNFATLLDYCKRSANPVGYLMLHLYQAATPENVVHSDKICSALQLINFWQDIDIDWQKQRIYIPAEDLTRFNLNEYAIAQKQNDQSWQSMMQFELTRTRTMLLEGAPLCKKLSGRIGFELRLVVQGGLRIIERLEQVNGDVFRRRPTIGARDWPIMIWRALKM